ncbi:hypothetical protein WCLP8_1280015 [uncultured Gammaproteobacteria bacterium]
MVLGVSIWLMSCIRIACCGFMPHGAVVMARFRLVSTPKHLGKHLRLIRAGIEPCLHATDCEWGLPLSVIDISVRFASLVLVSAYVWFLILSHTSRDGSGRG